jgi:coenzyme F420-0:L-glutamate ligase/coenzyme F420-1:gamma-L-glutamate ligase
MQNVPRIEVIGITGLPEIKPADKLGEMIADAADQQGMPLEPRDILVVTQKIVSKSEGRLVYLDSVKPSPFAQHFAARTGRDPRLVELVLRESRSIVRMDAERGIMITETKHGFVCANAGIDSSNVPGEGIVCLLPENPDASARRIRTEITQCRPGIKVAVIISDTFGRAWREGHGNFALGVSGIEPMKDYRGTPDANGRILKVTNIAIADELASAAELVTAKAINVPVAIVRGYSYEEDHDEGVSVLIRDRARDLFR